VGVNMAYGYTRQINMSYERVLERIKEELQKEGFGILSEIDVKATIKKKLNIDFDKYVILGACNPPFTHKALQAERQVGLFMPCNVIVYENDGKTFVSAALPTVTMSLINNPKLAEIGPQVESKLKKAVDAV
jgi:uncharacterized protein (DUF302 family)